MEAFEPLPKHHIGFQQNLKDATEVRLHRLALGSENTTGSLRVTDFSDASSLLQLAEASRTHFGLTEVETVPTAVRRLDDYHREAGLSLPDLIKLDVQGYELEVLKGAVECLRAAKAVISEVSVEEIYRGQCLFHEVLGFLAGQGLFVAALGAETPTASLLKQADVLFLRAPLNTL